MLTFQFSFFFADQTFDFLNFFKCQIFRINEIIGKIFEQKREDTKELRKKANKAIKDLERMLKDNSTKDSAIKKALEELKKLKKEMVALEEKARTQIENILSSRQFAQYILIERDFRHKMYKMMSKHGRGKEPRHQGPREE